nr:MerR family transcriptional regulator [uncultured Dialister sp.]
MRYYTSHDIERKMGIPATTLRYWEKKGIILFTGRSGNNTRIYTSNDIEKIKIAQFLKESGFSVNERSRLMSLIQAGDTVSLGKVIKALKEQKQKIESSIVTGRETMNKLDNLAEKLKKKEYKK